MKRLLSLTLLLAFACATAHAQLSFENRRPVFKLNDKSLLTTPAEGLWSVATGWQQDWMCGWVHASADEQKQSGEWTILSGKISLPQGDLLVRDSYREVRDGLVQCVRRYEWRGDETLSHVTLSVRLQLAGEALMPCLPGILYYGNKNGAKVDPTRIPVYEGHAGEFAIFEEHRYPMPFAMLENAAEGYAAALHTVPSPVRGAVLSDQWWSMGVEAKAGYSEFVLYSGPIGYNGQHSVAKALQRKPMRYADTYLNLEPGRIIEKTFYVELYPIAAEGTGFQKPIYTSLDMHKPYDADRFPSFDEIVRGKFNFAKSRWIDLGGDAVGFNMYDNSLRKELVMGWCGQADSPGFSLQVLADRLADPEIEQMVQRSMDFLTTYKVDPQKGIFPVRYDGKGYSQGDPVSCGQAMYNFAKAIEVARKNKKYDTRKWEIFLREAADAVSARILSEEWNPLSTAEGFYIAPLAIASKLFKNNTYKQAAERAAQLFADRHLKMYGCYWGGTLDATCEDKEGSWAAFQGFLEMYERFGEKRYLDWAKHAMDVCLSYVVVWDIPLPAGRLADFGFKTTGWTVVSAQNQHIDVYGVLFAPEVYRMGELLKDDRLCRLAKVMYRTCYQLTDPFGSQGEQLQQTNFAQHGDMSNVYKLRGGYSESWTVFWITAHFLNAAARFEEMDVEIKKKSKCL
ncbi:MAG: hypothetical protein IIW44_03330 [Alistipes sp.]|nr:hypothetical protein [Alistipes sp.]